MAGWAPAVPAIIVRTGKIKRFYPTGSQHEQHQETDKGEEQGAVLLRRCSEGKAEYYVPFRL
jgi:hypothetical protein